MLEGPPLVAEFLHRQHQTGGSVRAGVSEEALRAFEQLNGTLPVDMRSFYLAVDGMDDDSPFESWARILPIAEVVQVRRQFPGDQPEEALLIGDGMISAVFFAIDLAGAAGPPSSVYLVGPQALLVAASFGEFVNHILNDSPRLYHGDRPV